MSFSSSQTLEHALVYTHSVRYLDLALGKYEKLESEAKVVAAAASRLTYRDGFLNPFKLTKTEISEIFVAVSNFFNDIIVNFFKEFERKIYRAIINEDQEDYNIMRYIVACRKTNILEVDYEKAERRQKVLINKLMMKAKSYSTNYSLFINFFQTFCNEFILGTSIYTDVDKIQQLEFILGQCKTMKYMLWGAWPTYKLEGEHYNPVSTYLLLGRIKHLELMFKLGIDYAFSMSVYKITCGTFANIKHEEIVIWEGDSYKRLRHYKDPQRLHLILLNFCIFYLNISQLKKTSHNINKLKCLQLMWRSVRDAHVTVAEIETALKPLIKKDFEFLFEKTIEMYRNSTIFDNQQAQHSPRTLTHQCRGVIRRALSKNFCLPEGVDELGNIPEKLKDFLSLKC